MPACPPLPVGGLAEVPNRQTLLNVDIVVQCEFICCASSSSLLILLLFVVVCCCLLRVCCAFRLCSFYTEKDPPPIIVKDLKDVKSCGDHVGLALIHSFLFYFVFVKERFWKRKSARSVKHIITT